MRIKYVNYGIGFFVEPRKGRPYIELNRALKMHPWLYKRVLEHEKRHATGQKIDFWLEVRDFFDLKKQWELVKFTIRNPSALHAISPFPPGGINWFMLYFWISTILILGAFAILLK